MVRYVGVQGRGNVFRRVEERELLARGEVGLHGVGAKRGERGGRIEAELLDCSCRRAVAVDVQEVSEGRALACRGRVGFLPRWLRQANQ